MPGLSRQFSAPETHSQGQQVLHATGRVLTPEFTLCVKTKGREVEVPQPYFHPDYDLAASGRASIAEDDPIYCLRIASGVEGDSEYSLALRCVDLAEQAYERVGLVSAPLDKARRTSPTARTGHPRYFDTDVLVDELSSFTLDFFTPANERYVTGGWYEDGGRVDIFTII